MKRYVCIVTTGLLLALLSTGTATASLPLLDQSGTQATSFGDQTVGEQKNDADVTQKQGNGNLNIGPAIALFGDAESTNEQGNDNTATASVDQSNSVDQSQSSEQKQSLDQSGAGCCGGQSQAGEQKVYGGDQTVGEQRNDADVNQFQGNGNVNIAPAIAVFGDAETTNYQGNGNDADARVTQSNEATQSQSSEQKQWLEQDGDSCCGGQSQTGEQKTSFGDQTVEEQRNDADIDQWQGNGNLNIAPAVAIFGDAETANYQGNHNRTDATVVQSNDASQTQTSTQKQWLEQDGGWCCKAPAHCEKPDPCSAKKDDGEYRKRTYGKEAHSCCGGQSQTGEQRVYGGDQYVGKQKNDADVTQKQGNWNGSFAPAIGFGKGRGKGKGREHSCYARCEKPGHPFGGNAETTNKQGNGNEAMANVDQSNSVDQSQTSYQRQSLVQTCKGLVYR